MTNTDIKKIEELFSNELIDIAKEHMEKFQKLMAYYRCAMMEIETKLNVLNEEFSLQFDRNPINSIKSRIKSPYSIQEKLKKLNIPVTVENIISEVSRTFDVTAADIRSDKRSSNISLARQVAIYIVDQVTGLSLKAIGNEFGNKHHSTIIYALKEIKGKLEKDVSLKATVDDIIKNISEN